MSNATERAAYLATLTARFRAAKRHERRALLQEAAQNNARITVRDGLAVAESTCVTCDKAGDAAQ